MRYIQVIVAAAVCGSSYPFTKYLVSEVSPETVVTLRAVIGALLLTLVNGSRLEPSDFRLHNIWKIFIMIVAMCTMLVAWPLSGKAGELAAISAKGWVCAGYLGALSSALAYTFWNNSVEKLGPVTSSYFIYIQPFATTLSAYLFIGEPPAPGAFAGGLLILAGVYFVN